MLTFGLCNDAIGYIVPDQDYNAKESHELISVGPKAASAVMSVLSASELATAVATGDTALITRAQGVGPKLAQRVVLELKDKASKMLPSGIISAPSDIFEGRSEARVGSDNISEAISALVALGYSRSEALEALSGADAGQSADDLIRFALRKLARM